MGTGRQSYTVIVRCRFTVGGRAQRPGGCVEMSFYSLLEATGLPLQPHPKYKLIGQIDVLLPALGAFPLDRLYRKSESVASLYGGDI